MCRSEFLGHEPGWSAIFPLGFEHEVLVVIEALMKWEDKLVGRQFTIVTDHEALETIKTTNRDGKSG